MKKHINYTKFFHGLLAKVPKILFTFFMDIRHLNASAATWSWEKSDMQHFY